ncbi:hypothetical protein MLD38_039131 [Melastoma candidum]|uniref:Uncharacterized protein n=1 Tax=Melastoma candidum TaxID=119954 RepID=A0ACB9L202_9MYRT|nr:hypothetical protein MLD38_039131 [Melastoma candidum]
MAQFLSFTSVCVLLLLVLISVATPALGAPGGRHRGHGGKSKHKGGKCHGASCFSPARGHMNAILTLNSFQKGGDGGGPSECDGKFHSDDTLIVALSTGWYDHGRLCHKTITIHARNGRSTRATVVDECDVRRGCQGNIVDGSRAVWKALGIPKKDRGRMAVTWSL